MRKILVICAILNCFAIPSGLADDCSTALKSADVLIQAKTERINNLKELVEDLKVQRTDCFKRETEAMEKSGPGLLTPSFYMAIGAAIFYLIVQGAKR